MIADFLTVGHSNHPIDRFVAMLQAAGATLVADVRSKPFSRFSPQFNRKRLEAALAEAGIAYAWAGDDLGGRPDLPLVDGQGRHKYQAMTASPEFARGIARIEAMATEAAGTGGRVCLMCKERDPATCHRGLMIAPTLRAHGHGLHHILADGTVRTDNLLL